MTTLHAYNSHLYLLLFAAHIRYPQFFLLKGGGLKIVSVCKKMFGKARLLIGCTSWLCALLLLPATLVAADTLSDIQRTGSQKVTEGKASQDRVNKLSETTQRQLREYRLLQKQIEGLETYNKQLDKQIQSQETLIEKYEASISEVASIERQMTPLVVKMVKSLEDFIELDMPFHMTERRERLSRIEENLVAADINVAEKFRQIIEAYQIENEYGRKVDSYQDIAIINGVGYEVDVLRVGRIALVCQTKDTSITAAWDNNSKSWRQIDSGDYRNAIREGLKMANKQAPVNMLVLPVSAAGDAL